MKLLIQVVDNASVSVENTIINQIGNGYLIFVGIEPNDTKEKISKFASKVIHLRINKDENDKTNLSILDVKGSILSISQFTLCATLDSRRPSFTNAAKPDLALELYNYFNEQLKTYGIVIKDGAFGKEMIVDLKNHGPFTIYMDDNDL